MLRINDYYAAAATELQDLIPDLNGVRNETLSVLYGQTADAADEQFAMLFDGDYAVDKLAKGVLALGGGAQNLGSQIQYSKLSIIVGLALAAAEISYCLANAAPTAGVSTTLIPGIEAATTAGIRGIVGRTLLRIDMKLTEMLGDTMIKQMAFHAPIEALQELSQGLAQEVIVQGIQVGAGTGHWQPQLFMQNGIASFIGGAAGGATAVPVGRWLGAADSKLGRAAKGMTTNFSAGISGNIAGTAVVGGEFNPLAMIASSAGSSIGGIRGGHAGSHENNTTDGEQSDLSHGDREPSNGRPPDLSPDELSDGSFDDAQRDDPDAAEPKPRAETPSVNGNSHTSQGGSGARVLDSRTSDSVSAAAKHTNNTAAQKDSPASTPPTTDEVAKDNETEGASQDASSAKHTPDVVPPPVQSSDAARHSDAHTANEPNGHRPTPSEPISEETPPPTQDGQAPEVHAPGDTSQSAVDRAAAFQTETPSVADVADVADPSQPASVAGPSAAHVAPTATASTSATNTPPPAAASPTHSSIQAPGTTPKQTVCEDVPTTLTPAASTSKVSGAETSAARVRDTTAAHAKPSAQQSDAEQGPVARSATDEPAGSPRSDPTTSDSSRPAPRRADCVDRVAQALSRRYGRDIQLAPFSTAEGAPARVLYETFRSRAEFASYRKIAKTLQRLGPGSSAIVTSSWEGGPNRGGHAYLAVNEGGRIYLDDPFTGTRTGWPPHWGRDAVSRVAVGYLHADGNARHELGNAPRDLAAAVAVGDVQGHPGESDPGSRWRHVTPQRRLADDALTQRGVRSAAELRNPLGLMEAGSERARDNTTWWHGLTGDEQRALIDIYPHEIGNAEGIPAAARHEANTHALDQQRTELQDWRDRGQRLTHSQRKELFRLERIQHALDRATDVADKAGVGGPQLLAFDSGAFGGSGRAVVSFGEDPYKAELVAWHVPGQGMTVDQLGYCMGDALNHLQSIRAEDSSVSASTIAWIGYDTPSGLTSWRASGHTLAREGAKILYADIRAFSAARDTMSGDGSHFNGNHIFAHSYGSITASYAGQDGRLANDVRTITLAGSPGAGPLRHAADFGIGADHVFVASSSRDPFTALGGRRPGSLGRVFGIGLGMDPAMESFGAHRVTAEFSAALDHRGTRFTHNSYFRFEDRGADPPLRSESLANFGRIATGHIDRVDTEAHRTIDEQPRRHFGGTRERTVEPATDRPLRLDGDSERHRGARRLGNPRWRGEDTPSVEPTSHTDGGEHTLDGGDAHLEPQMSTEERAHLALQERGIQDAAHLMSPADHRVPVADAVARADANARWWRGLSDAQKQALIETYPHEVGNAEGIPPMYRHEANALMLQQYLADRDILVSRRDSGVAISKKDQQFVDLMDQIERAIRRGERNALKAGVGGPYLLALDPFAFDGVGRAIVSFGADPYTATSVSWYVPGMSTTIEKLGTMMQRGFNQLQSTLRENPDLAAASITYLGYKPPGSWDRAVLSQDMAIDGGQIFASDMLSFNVGRDIFTADGSHFRGHHIFAHSYGSSTVSHAGVDGRLGNDVQTITLIGSPGAGPLLHARDFGIGAENVFVASSSRDLTTALGGDRPGHRGRNHRPERLGQGVDPAMDSFGAQRITAEFPAAIDRAGAGSRMTHSLYWAYMDPGANPHVRSESLANFGRIAAGRDGDVDTEGHRRLDARPRWLRSGTSERTVEPAIGRHLRLADDPTVHHSVKRRHFWNPRFRNVPSSAVESRHAYESRQADESSHDHELTAAEVGEVQQVAVPVKVVADAALQDRGIHKAADLMSPVNHRVPTRDAVARAEANGKWWRGLTDNQRQALIETYPHEIGNAEGIPPIDRHEANSRMLQRYLAHRDVLASRRENGVALNKHEERFVGLMNEIEDALRKGVVNAQRAGVGGPYLLALDPRAFGGAGRAIVSFGEDPYTAKSVSWYVPGMTTTIDKMHPMMMRAFNQLQSTLRENPDLSAASICYIGYRAPGSWDPKVIFQRLARQGGSIFASDISSFNTGRDVFTGDGSHFRGNHVFAHSYGSSTVSHAGRNRQLARQMQTVTLIGSPGAGPLRHASQFGIGADNVFVAASSRDKTPGLGGDRPGRRGRNFAPRRIGQGIDPAMDTFGARRVTAEFPAALDHMGRGSRMTHSLYWAYMDPGTNPHIRSESLTNFGRIAAGHVADIDPEQHRYLDRRPRPLLPGTRENTVEPALGRHLRLADDPAAPHSVHGRNYWNPKFFRVNDCGPAVIDELSALYPDHEFHLASGPSSNGVHAFRLFEAVRSSSEFATYTQIESRLRDLGHRSSALIASSWRGFRSGGHAYLAVNDGGEIYLLDAHTGERSGWPPHWGQDAVRRTAVGYLDSDGEPVVQYEGRSRQLAAAGRIGRVQGHSESGVVADAALGSRGIRADDLVNPVGSSELATERARSNAEWWAALSGEQQQALIDVHAYRVGNAEGIPAVDRDTANRAFLQELRDRADHVQTKIDEFAPVTTSERKFLQRVNQIDLALRRADADAVRAGLDPPLVLALDPSEFGGKGRVVISFGADPYHAESVSWHTARETVDQLGTVVRPALDQLQSTLHQTSSAAAVVWIGDETAKPRLALHSDVAAFHAAREALSETGDGRPFTGNRIHTPESTSTTEHTRRLWVSRDGDSRVVAHRGASHEYPEQTLAAYQEALRQGADGLECDIRLTKDGQLVCIHDKRIDRTSNGTGRVGDMTLAELQRFDFGSQHPSRELGDAQGDTGILTLDQLLQLVTDHDRPVTLFIEAKEHGGRLERELVALLERHGLANPASAEQSRVAVISFYPDAIWRVHRAAPDLPTVLLGSAVRHLAGVVGATAIGPSIKTLRAHPELVDIAARQGLTTYCWTVNDESDVQFARDLGVGWIATDHPGRTGTVVHGAPTEPAGQHAQAQQTDTPAAHVPAHSDTDADTVRVAEAALAQRIPPVRPDELRNPLGSMEEARARARNNANWWSGLTADQRQALIETHPQHVGNAEGIAAADRHTANHRVLQQLRDRADRVQAKIDDGGRPTRAERKFVRQLNQLDLALRKADADATRAGVDGPMLIAFDPAEFGGDGRAVLSFGEDPYKAESVSWHVPGIRTTMHSFFGFQTGAALHHLQSTLTENPTASAASIAWIGYDTPSGWKLWRAAGDKLARTGGDILYADITAFNAARDTLAGDGSHFSGNHVFGHSYGSTTTGYAGRDGRLADQVRTISLLGSPGAGPVRHASDFGIGAENVFAASSSRDVVTALGGRTADSGGRILGRGLGIDPAMDSFGAQRIAAESPAGRNRFVTGGTHLAYYLDTDTGSHARSESLANLGRIAAGNHDQLTHEPHRTVDGWRSVEPAASRSDHHIWNPLWRSDRDCAHVVADELSSMYGRDIHIAEAPSRAGVPARSLFEAVGARAEFATYDEVAARLTQLGDGSSAVLASRWAGGRNGGHAYVAVNDGGQIHLYDPHTRQRSGWPPHWGEDAVSRTAVGYLGVHGNSLDPLTVDAPLQLAAADAVGQVQGHPVDPDFVQRQAEYRAQDLTSRHVDTRYAVPLGDVVDSPTRAGVNQLAEDLSGQYGPHRIQLKGEVVNDEVMLTGRIYNGDTEIGTIQRSFYRDREGNLVAYHSGLVIKEGFEHLRGKGFSKALTSELERYYVHSGVDRIGLHTHDLGAYAWLRRGFIWDPDPRALQKSFDAIKASANRLRQLVDPEARAALDQIVAELDPNNPRLPEGIEVANLATRNEPQLGRQLLDGVSVRRDGTGLDLVRYLARDISADASSQSHSGFGARIKRLFGLGGGSRSDQDCAHLVADELSAMYEGQDIRVATARSPMGTPAWALFEAVGTGAEFATYDEVTARLHQLGDGSSAVLASRWAEARRGGHAYLAVNEGGDIYLYDPHNGERSGWPPHWGQDAVRHTAVGYLGADGHAVHPLHDVPLQLQLAAADVVGDVKGHSHDPDFVRRQEEYRAEDPTTRRVDARYAEPLGNVVDSASSAGAGRLAADLSGNYGSHRVQLDSLIVRGRGFMPDGDMLSGDQQVVILEGPVHSGERQVGSMAWSFHRDDDGNLIAHYELAITDEDFQGREFTQSMVSALAPYFTSANVDRVTSANLGKSAYAAVDLGDSWDPDPERLQQSVENVRKSAFELRDQVGGEARRVLDRIVQRLEPEHARLPEPADLANLYTFDEPELGRRLLEGTGSVDDGTALHYVKYLWNTQLHPAQNCGHWAVDHLSARFGQEFHIAGEPSPTGVPARLLFEAIGSRADFHSYREVEELLAQMDPGRPGGPGPAALIVSSWAGGENRGAHAYLAVYDGGRVYLEDVFTGERLPWPPYWGEGAVSRTAVGFLDAGGRPVQRLDGGSGQLVAADAIGDVQGHPGEGTVARADMPDERYPSPDDVELAELRDRVAQLDPTALTPEAIAEAVYQPVPTDDVTSFYEGRVSGFKTGEVVRAQHHVAESQDDAFFVSADIANLRGLNQASADRTEANAHFSALADIFDAGLVDSGADVVPMRVGGDELSAVVVGDIDQETIDSALATIRARVQEYAQQHNLSDIPHPKHPGQPEYNGVGLHIGYAELLPDLDVRDIFNIADLGVDQSKTRRTDVAGGPGRAAGPDGADSGGAAAARRGDGTRTGREAEDRESEARGRAGAEGEHGRPLTDRVRYPQPEEVKRAKFLEEAAQVSRDPAPEEILALRESLRADEVSGFYDGRGAAFKTGEVARARQWAVDTDSSGFLVSAQMDNLSGLNQHTQNRAEVANAHYRAVTEIFRTEIEATGATVVPMRTGGDRFDAIVVGGVDAAAVDAAIVEISRKIDIYTRREGLSDIANPSNPEQRGVHLRFGYADITTHSDVEHIVQSAERQMFGRNDFGDPRRQSAPEPDVDIPLPRQADAAENLSSPRTQQEYREQNRTIRAVDTRFAEPLGDVLDNADDQGTVDQLAKDLSGVYWPYRVDFRGEGNEDVFLAGVILRGNSPIGKVELDFFRDSEGRLVASVDWIEIFDENLRRKGFLQSLVGELERYCRSSDVPEIRLATQDNGGIAWARMGFTWDRDPHRLEMSLDSVKASAQLQGELAGDARTVLDEIVHRLDPNRSDLPEPKFLTELATRDVPDLGRRLMDGTNWFAVKHLGTADTPQHDIPLRLEMNADVPPSSQPVGAVTESRDGADFLRRQEEYRAQDPTTRRVDTRYAESLGDVLESLEPQQAQQLADDLSGLYGSYGIEMQAKFGANVVVEGVIFTGDTDIGSIKWSFRRDDLGKLVVDLELLLIDEGRFRGQGLFTLRRDLLPLFERSDVERLELTTMWQGSILWARHGFTWNSDSLRLHESLDSIKSSARQLRGGLSDEARAVLDAVVQQLEPGRPRLPEPIDLLRLATPDEPKLGHKLLNDTTVSLVVHLRGADSDPTALSRSGSEVSPSPGSREDAVSLSGFTCAHLVAGAVSARYGRDIGIDAESTPTGVPARALFQAVESDAQFATYREVAIALRDLGPGSSAVLASRWRGHRQGGHAYLAVNDGGRIDLFDAHTGVRSGWPPHWGQDAVARTAVGYLDADGRPVRPLHDVPLQLAAADAVGDIKGHAVDSDAALAQRIPPVSAADLVHPIGDPLLAVERAQANATWWQGLSEDLRRAMVENHPVQIGNAEGIPPSYCHEANTRALQHWLRNRDQLQSRRDAGFRLGFDRQRELDFLNSVDDAMQRGADAARQVGVGGPHLLRFDPTAFDGNGIAIVGFGVDPHFAESVSWHIPGRGAAIDQLGAAMGSALNQMSSVLLESPTASAASITWIGYNTIADGAARAGGENLYSDIRAFNAGRDAWAADGSHFTNNHVYGHCQGSTVVGYAGVNARLDRAVQAVILFGSPGMGPINHAGEFGPGVDVYVAASSTDSFTWDAGHTPGSRGVFLDGFGVDPAMDFFGAQRITAEFPLLRMARAGDYDMHNFYYKFDDKSAGARTESLANFGRIATGHLERVAFEGHRTVVAQPDQDVQVREPASVRPAVDDHGPPVADPIDNCAHGVADLLSARYPGRDVRVDASSSPTGVPARALFEAVRSGAEFTDYQRVAERLRDLGPGSSAVLASRWAGVRHGGHAYLAINDDDTIHLVDPRTGRHSGWPPYWGEIAVDQTAVGFLDDSGAPVRDSHLGNHDLVAADAIGNVQGGPNDPVSQLGLPDYEPRSLSDVEASTVYSHGEHRMRELSEQLIRDGVSLEDRARILSEQRNSPRAWTRDLMSNRTTAEVLVANESNHTFADLVARHEERGLIGDAVHEAIIDAATHSRYAPGTLSGVETTAVYSEFEHRLRELNERLIRGGVSVEERARALSDLRSSLRTWTRELMANRAAADWLATNENPLSFEDLVARKEARGLVGDAVYEDIIDSATHSHYPSGTLSDLETRTVYTTLELRMREVHDQLLHDGVNVEERARTLYGLRASIRSWARTLMADREAAESLDATDPNPTFEALVERQRRRGRVGDEIYEVIIASATRSRDSVNKALGIDPENPPPLPPMRGPTNNE